MPANANQVVVGGTGLVLVAPTTEAAPTNATTPLTGNWQDLGFTSEDGVTVTDSKDIEEIGAWQSFYPIRRIITGRDFTVSFALRQWSRVNVILALGGGTVTGSSPWTYTPPSPGSIDNRSLVVSWQDGSKSYRLYVPVGMVTESVETNITRTGASDLPITFSATSDGTTNPYTLFTTDSSFS